jgi:hypothetical protein
MHSFNDRAANEAHAQHAAKRSHQNTLTAAQKKKQLASSKQHITGFFKPKPKTDETSGNAPAAAVQPGQGRADGVVQRNEEPSPATAVRQTGELPATSPAQGTAATKNARSPLQSSHLGNPGPQTAPVAEFHPEGAWAYVDGSGVLQNNNGIYFSTAVMRNWYDHGFFKKGTIIYQLPACLVMITHEVVTAPPELCAFLALVTPPPPPPPPPGGIKISGLSGGVAKYNQTYAPTGKISTGLPCFKSASGSHLYYENDYWNLNGNTSGTGDAFFRGKIGPVPLGTNSWSTWNGTGFVDAKVTVSELEVAPPPPPPVPPSVVDLATAAVGNPSSHDVTMDEVDSPGVTTASSDEDADETPGNTPQACIGGHRRELLDRQKKKRKPAVDRNAWKPHWVGERGDSSGHNTKYYDFLRTIPEHLEEDEAPNAIFCFCCVQFAEQAKKERATLLLDWLCNKENQKDGKYRADLITRHANSDLHASCVRLAHKARPEQAGQLHLQVPRTPEETQQALENLIRTAIIVGLEKNPAAAVRRSCKLQIANGANISTALTSSCGVKGSVQQIWHAGASVLKNGQNARIRKSPFHSEMGDGSTDMTHTEMEIIHTRLVTSTREGTDFKKTLRGARVVNEFMNLRPVEVVYSKDGISFDAAAILMQYDAEFLERGLMRVVNMLAGNLPDQINSGILYGPDPDQVYPSRQVSVSGDGASVNHGKYNGMLTMMARRIVWLLVTKAIAHKIELAVGDALLVIDQVKKNMAVDQRCYVKFSKSGKKHGIRKQIADDMGETCGRLAGMHGIRWREASYRQLLLQIQNYRTIVATLEKMATTKAGLGISTLSADDCFPGLRASFSFAGEGGIKKRYTGRVRALLQPSTKDASAIFEVYFVHDKTVMQLTKAEIVAGWRELDSRLEEFKQSDEGDLHNELVQFIYVVSMHFLADVAYELMLVSKAFQKDFIIFTEMKVVIKTCTANLREMKTNDGKWLVVFKKDFVVEVSSLATSCSSVGSLFDSSCTRHRQTNTFDGHDLQNVEAGLVEFIQMREEVCDELIYYIGSRFDEFLENAVLNATDVFVFAR